ncbi:hypothetical protein B9Z65_6482 [Elsinoe australis]|uniref:Uncharacterized protein n=1 Tax=Elsinoe australis TaxID=40998 RepID=A0A2P8A8T1_9PEZI|nr:hypothetical protein B9Z65_6482 [Elsinoe australis]
MSAAQRKFAIEAAVMSDAIQTPREAVGLIPMEYKEFLIVRYSPAVISLTINNEFCDVIAWSQSEHRKAGLETRTGSEHDGQGASSSAPSTEEAYQFSLLTAPIESQYNVSRQLCEQRADHSTVFAQNCPTLAQQHMARTQCFVTKVRAIDQVALKLRHSVQQHTNSGFVPKNADNMVYTIESGIVHAAFQKYIDNPDVEAELERPSSVPTNAQHGKEGPASEARTGSA